jgi:hypothetical protein
MKVGSFTFEGVTFDFTVANYPDNEMPELCVTIRGYEDSDVTVVAAFNRGGLTLCGDSVHLAVDGDETFVDDGSAYASALESAWLTAEEARREEEWLTARRFQL